MWDHDYYDQDESEAKQWVDPDYYSNNGGIHSKYYKDQLQWQSYKPKPKLKLTAKERRNQYLQNIEDVKREQEREKKEKYDRKLKLDVEELCRKRGQIEYGYIEHRIREATEKEILEQRKQHELLLQERQIKNQTNPGLFKFTVYDDDIGPLSENIDFKYPKSLKKYPRSDYVTGFRRFIEDPKYINKFFDGNKDKMADYLEYKIMKTFAKQCMNSTLNELYNARVVLTHMIDPDKNYRDFIAGLDRQVRGDQIEKINILIKRKAEIARLRSQLNEIQLKKQEFIKTSKKKTKTARKVGLDAIQKDLNDTNTLLLEIEKKENSYEFQGLLIEEQGVLLQDEQYRKDRNTDKSQWTIMPAEEVSLRDMSRWEICMIDEKELHKTVINYVLNLETNMKYKTNIVTEKLDYKLQLDYVNYILPIVQENNRIKSIMYILKILEYPILCEDMVDIIFEYLDGSP
jgi:hypothetical protein